MSKKLMQRFLSGIPLGIMIGQIITLYISFRIGNGLYYIASPELIELSGSELNAVLIQTVWFAIVGGVFGALSLVWNQEQWALFNRSLLFCLAGGATLLIAASFCKWIEPSIGAVLSFLVIYLAIFLVVWVIQYFWIRRNIRKMNDSLNRR